MAQPIMAKNVPAERVDWIWNERIPAGMVTTVAGRPDQGKGLFAVHLAAHVSKGGRNVLYSAAEDSHGLMTRPRLEAAGADLSKVLLWRFRLPENMKELTELVLKYEIRLLILDPFASHLTGGVSRHSDNVRTVIGPLAELMEATGCACVIIEHALKKSAKVAGHILNVIGGSGSGLPAASRVVYVFGQDPDDDDRRVLAPAKCNIRDMPPAVSFEVDVEDVPRVGAVPMLLNTGELETFDPLQMFAAPKKDTAKVPPASKRAEAAEWLTVHLAGLGGSQAQKAVYEDARQRGMSLKTLRRAANDMGVIRGQLPSGVAGWTLPPDVLEAMGFEDADPSQDPVADPDDSVAVPALTDEDFNALLGGDEPHDDPDNPEYPRSEGDADDYWGMPS